jgi:hypothetical protein
VRELLPQLGHDLGRAFDEQKGQRASSRALPKVDSHPTSVRRKAAQIHHEGIGRPAGDLAPVKVP